MYTPRTDWRSRLRTEGLLDGAISRDAQRGLVLERGIGADTFRRYVRGTSRARENVKYAIDLSLISVLVSPKIAWQKEEREKEGKKERKKEKKRLTAHFGYPWSTPSAATNGGGSNTVRSTRTKPRIALMVAGGDLSQRKRCLGQVQVVFLSVRGQVRDHQRVTREVVEVEWSWGLGSLSLS